MTGEYAVDIGAKVRYTDSGQIQVVDDDGNVSMAGFMVLKLLGIICDVQWNSVNSILCAIYSHFSVLTTSYTLLVVQPTRVC